MRTRSIFLVTFFLSLTLASAALADTVTITKVEYKADRSEFKVEATSSDGGNVTLTVAGFGAMDYDSRKNKYKFRVKPVEVPPCTAVVVSSGGGSDTRVTGANPCLDDDADAPTPNPTFDSVVTGPYSITMAATPASDPSGVEYLFKCTADDGSGSDSDSGWQDSASFTATGLTSETPYTCTVAARDKSANQNTTAASAVELRTEEPPPPDVDPPTPNPPTFASPPSADSSSAISMTAATGSDASGLVEYSFVEVTGNPGGSNSGWQESASYTDTGLDANTTYTYMLQLRDAAKNVGIFSTAASATTPFVPNDSVNITKVEYKADRSEFKVEATSSDGGNVTLTVAGFGAMDYDAGKDKYKFRVKPVEVPPCTAVVVSSGGGSDTRDTGANPCLDDDPDAPTPNPMTFDSVVPGPYSITMAATPASDTSGVEYLFTCTAGDGSSSDSVWQDSASFTATGLTSETQYTCTVTARDKSANQNTTAASAGFMVQTIEPPLPDSDPPTPNPPTFASPPSADSSSAISMTATTGSDASGPVEYSFVELTGNPGGSNSGWQESASYTDTGLDANTQYTYMVQLRDAAQNVGIFSTEASATTLFVPNDSVNITKVEYKADRSEFKVEATSSDGGNVTLTVVGFGAMDYDAGRDKFKFSIKPLNQLPPCTAVVVSSGGGSDTRDTGASPCDGTGGGGGSGGGGTGGGGGTDDAADLESISSRYKDLVMGGNDSDVPGYLALLDGSGRFTDINYGATSRDSGWDVAEHLERSLALAQAYEKLGSEYYQDASIRDAVFSTISGWISGTPSNVNWWWSTIGWPKTASSVGVIMKDALVTHDNSLRNSLVSYLKSASWNKIGNQAGANATDVQLVGLAACAIGDDHNLCETVVNSMLSTINYKTGNNDGLMTDLSFTQHNYHGRQLYHNGYANVYLLGFLNIATVVRDSSLRVPESKDALIEEFFLGGVQHLIYGEHYSDILVSGRGYAKNPTYAPNSKTWRWPLERLIDYGTARKAELQVLLDRMMGVTPENTVANKMFWHTDFMTHIRPNYYTSVRGTSTRTVGNESLQGTGKLSYHMGDGVNMVLHHGDEYKTILPIWDWRRLPGTTIEQRTGSLPLVEGGNGGTGGNSYAGGVSDGQYGAYGFIFDEGGQNSNVEAYKAHFFFDDEFVALGAGISALNAGNYVMTTVNQTLHKGDFTVGRTSGQQPYASGSVPLAKNDWVHHYDIGYLMLDHDGETSASVDWQTGALSDHTNGLSNDLLGEFVFNLGIDHGQGFSDKTYGYVVVPGVSVSDMSNYAANPQIQVLSNTTTVQAVHHDDLDITSALFYQPGSLTMADGSILTSDKAVAVLVKKAGADVMVSVASPQYSSMTAKITLEGELTGDNVSYNAYSDVSTITFSLASGNDKGRTVTHALINPHGS